MTTTNSLISLTNKFLEPKMLEKLTTEEVNGFVETIRKANKLDTITYIIKNCDDTEKVLKEIKKIVGV